MKHEVGTRFNIIGFKMTTAGSLDAGIRLGTPGASEASGINKGTSEEGQISLKNWIRLFESNVPITLTYCTEG